MPHRKITVEEIEAEANPERKVLLAKAAWFHHGNRAKHLTEILDRIENPTPENAHVLVFKWADDVEGLKRQIAFHSAKKDLFHGLWVSCRLSQEAALTT